MSKVLIISDPHFPFAHPDTLIFLRAVQRKHNTNKTVCIGDLLDNHALSRFDHDPDGDAPGPELRRTIEQLRPFYRAFPRVQVCYGNHDLRAYKKAFTEGIPKAFLRSLKETLQAPRDWEWSDSFEIDGVCYMHGDMASLANIMQTLPLKNAQSTVFGHLHKRAGILYQANSKSLFFGMNVGCLIDTKAYAFAYGKSMVEKPIISCGVVLDGLPAVVPMVLNSKGRWTGKL